MMLGKHPLFYEQCNSIDEVGIINQISLSYLPNPNVSVKATTSDLSFVTLNSPTPISATPLLARANIPVQNPLPDIQPSESAS